MVTLIHGFTIGVQNLHDGFPGKLEAESIAYELLMAKQLGISVRLPDKITTDWLKPIVQNRMRIDTGGPDRDRSLDSFAYVYHVVPKFVGKGVPNIKPVQRFIKAYDSSGQFVFVILTNGVYAYRDLESEFITIFNEHRRKGT